MDDPMIDDPVVAEPHTEPSPAQSRRLRVELRAAEARLRSLVLTAADIVWTTAPDGATVPHDEFHGISDRFWTTFTGQTAAESAGFGWLHAVHPDERVTVEAGWRQCVAAGAAYEAEYRVRRHDGDYRVLASRGAPVRDDSGAITQWIGTCTDVTERRETEADRDRVLTTLAHERGLFTAVLDQLPSGVIVAEAPSGRTILNNRAASEILGYPPVEAESLDEYAAYTLLHPDDRRYAASEYPLVRAITVGETIQDDGATFMRGDGTRGTLWINAAPVRDDSGQVIAGVVIYRDVSERTVGEARQALLAAAGEALAASIDYESTLRDLARLTVPAIADACVVDILGPNGEILPVATVADPPVLAVLEELRFRFPATMGRPYGVARVLTTGRPTFLPEIRDDRRETMAVDDDHLRLLRLLGTRSNITVPLVARGEILGTLTLKRIRTDLPPYGLADLAFAEDLGRRAALALDNARLLREARSAVSLRDEFLSSVSHDLKNPLAAIRGRVQLLQRRAAKDGTVAPERLQRGLEEIEAAAAKLQLMIDELQDVSSLQMGRSLTIDRRPTDLVQLARDMILVAGEISSRHIVHLGISEPELTAEVDPGRFGRVLDNLLSNAIKYSPDGGEVTVTIRRAPGRDGGHEWAEIAVRDRGIGIPAADLPRLFERFYRGSNVTNQISGSGIGLAGVHLIVTQHGGTISVDSVDGAGSTFTVRLPLR